MIKGPIFINRGVSGWMKRRRFEVIGGFAKQTDLSFSCFSTLGVSHELRSEPGSSA